MLLKNGGFGVPETEGFLPRLNSSVPRDELARERRGLHDTRKYLRVGRCKPSLQQNLGLKAWS